MCENTKAQIAIMQAFVDGKKIEYNHYTSTGWTPTIAPIWDWDETDYRVAEDMELKAYKIYAAEWDPVIPTDIVPSTRAGLRALINAVKAGDIT